MYVRTKEGIEIDTESAIYKRYLRVAAIEARAPHVAEPAPYRTLGERLEQERWAREAEADANAPALAEATR